MMNRLKQNWCGIYILQSRRTPPCSRSLVLLAATAGPVDKHVSCHFTSSPKSCLLTVVCKSIIPHDIFTFSEATKLYKWLQLMVNVVMGPLVAVNSGQKPPPPPPPPLTKAIATVERTRSFSMVLYWRCACTDYSCLHCYIYMDIWRRSLGRQRDRKSYF